MHRRWCTPWGEGFVLVQTASGSFVIGMGENLWQAPLSGGDGVNVIKCSEFSSFLTGLLLTLGDQKALLFYLTFLPVFLDTSCAETVGYMPMLGTDSGCCDMVKQLDG